jgi:beta-glucosidase
MYTKEKPLYPFGYGLSYTAFKYSNLRLSANTLHNAGTTDVSIDICNTGKRAGDEVVQMYITHLNSKVIRPLEELKGFERVHLRVGETKTITMPLAAETLRYWDEAEARWLLEPDQVEIRVGASSDDVRARHTIHVVP